MEERRYSSWMLERIGIGDTVRIRMGASTIGRHSSSVIRILDSAYVSRHHAVIEVSEDDKSVSLQDVSSNGIYVNDIRYDKVTIQLNANDIIGIGVTTIDFDNGVDVMKLPIYQLKYAPIRPLRKLSTTNRPLNTNTVLTPAPTAAPALLKDIENTNKPMGNNTNKTDERPCCSRTIKIEKIEHNEQIFEISDDDDEDDKPEIVLKSKNQETSKEKETNQDKSKVCEDQEKESVNIKSEPKKEENDKNINLTQKSQDKIKNIIGQIEKEAKETSKQNDIITTQKKQDVIKEISKEIPNESLAKDIPNNVENFYTSQEPSKENSKPNDRAKDNNIENRECGASVSNKKLEEKVSSLMHVPIISNIKKEIIRSVSADIENIFGDLDEDDELKKTIKEINPLVYKEIQVTKNLKPLEQTDDIKLLNNGDFIVLTDDDDLEVEELGTIYK